VIDRLPRLAQACVPLLLSSAAAGQSIEPLVVDGDPIPGVGNVDGVGWFAVNDNGEWLAWVTTDHANPDADRVLLKSGSLYFQEGQNLAEPPGTQLDWCADGTLTESDDATFRLTLEDSTGWTSGVYWNTSLLFQDSDPTFAPEFNSSTSYDTILGVHGNAFDKILVHARMYDSWAVEWTKTLMLVDTDGAGSILSEGVVKKERDLAGSGSTPIYGFDIGSWGSELVDINDVGQVMYYAELEPNAGLLT